MNKDSRIFIAGHRGMVGSAVCRRLESLGYRNRVVRSRSELDLTRQAEVEAFFAAERPDIVFLAAARVGGIMANSTRPAEFIYDNLAIATHVIHAAWRTGVRRLLNFGSSCIYPKLAPQPLREEYLLTGPLEPTNEAYAVAKIAAIRLCRHFNDQYGTDFLSVMPTNLYGPGDNYDLVGSHVLPALIRKFYLARRLAENDLDAVRHDLVRHRSRLTPGEDRPEGADPATAAPADLVDFLADHGITAAAVTLWGSGSPRREFLHVDDLAGAAVHLVEHCSAAEVGEFVNVGCGEDLPIAELAEMVREVVGYRGVVAWDATKPDGTPRKLLDISRVRALGWAPRISLGDGIAATYAGYLAGA